MFEICSKLNYKKLIDSYAKEGRPSALPINVMFMVVVYAYINSYEVQTRYYTEKINAEPKWKLIRLADILENQPLAFDDGLIRQMLQCVVVQSKDCIKVIFNDGTEIDQPLQ